MTDEEFLLRIDSLGGWMFPDEMLWLRRMAKQRNTIAEIGVWQGRSSFALASGTSGVLYAVDHWQGSDGERETFHAMAATKTGGDRIYETAVDNLREFIDAGSCVLIREESTTAANTFDDASFDMVFIDGGHTYGSAAADIAAWRPKLKVGGLICGHDYKQELGCYDAVNAAFGSENITSPVGSIWVADLPGVD